MYQEKIYQYLHIELDDYLYQFQNNNITHTPLIFLNPYLLTYEG